MVQATTLTLSVPHPMAPKHAPLAPAMHNPSPVEKPRCSHGSPSPMTCFYSVNIMPKGLAMPPMTRPGPLLVQPSIHYLQLTTNGYYISPNHEPGSHPDVTRPPIPHTLLMWGFRNSSLAHLFYQDMTFMTTYDIILNTGLFVDHI